MQNFKNPAIQTLQLCAMVLSQQNSSTPVKDLVQVSKSMQSMLRIFQAAETEVKAQEQAVADSFTCNRLIAIVLQHAEEQGIGTNSLPLLKTMSIAELRSYINREFPELMSHL